MTKKVKNQTTQIKMPMDLNSYFAMEDLHKNANKHIKIDCYQWNVNQNKIYYQNSLSLAFYISMKSLLLKKKHSPWCHSPWVPIERPNKLGLEVIELLANKSYFFIKQPIFVHVLAMETFWYNIVQLYCIIVRYSAFFPIPSAVLRW